MSETEALEPVRRAVRVPVTLTWAFAVFTRGFGSWWPREYTWGGDALDAIGIEPRVGGRCFERGPHGFSCDWGRVLVWEPPQRLAFTWQITAERLPQPDPAKASEVEVRFVGEGALATRVELEHRGFARHGAGAAGYRAGMASSEGWPKVLELYAAAARGDGRPPVAFTVET